MRNCSAVFLVLVIIAGLGMQFFPDTAWILPVFLSAIVGLLVGAVLVNHQVFQMRWAGRPGLSDFAFFVSGLGASLVVAWKVESQCFSNKSLTKGMALLLVAVFMASWFAGYRSFEKEEKIHGQADEVEVDGQRVRPGKARE